MVRFQQNGAISGAVVELSKSGKMYSVHGNGQVTLQKLLSAIQLSLRAAVAAGASIGLAYLFKLQHPIYALLAAVIVTDLSPSRTSKLGLQRLAATVVGAACGATLRHILEPTAWAIALGILIAMLISLLSPAKEGAKVAGYVCGIVMLVYGDHPWSYAFFRLIETLLGVGVAWAISFVPKLVRVDDPGR